MAGQKLQISRLLNARDVDIFLPSLRTLLQSCVNLDPAASSIGFLAPLKADEAENYWDSIGTQLDAAIKTCYAFVLRESDTSVDILATVQLFTIPKATHAHRGEIAKLLVRPSAQRRGLGRIMMHHVEKFAKEDVGLEVLTLDTETDTPARAFYNRIGWTEWGTCPAYAAFADGRLGSATFFRKVLR